MLDKNISTLKFLTLISTYVRKCPCFHKISTEVFVGKLNFIWFSTNDNINCVCVYVYVCVYKECVLAQMWQNVNNWRNLGEDYIGGVCTMLLMFLL